MSLEAKLRDTEDAVAAGADEIDMVISREAFLAGDDTRVMEEIVAVKERCGDAHLKVILETAELGSYDHVRHASMLAMEAGADFIKTSTGKAPAGATPGVCLVMLEAIRDYARAHRTDRRLQGRRRRFDEQGRAPPPRARQGDARRRVADARAASGSARRPCSMICLCSTPRPRPGATGAQRTSPRNDAPRREPASSGTTPRHRSRPTTSGCATATACSSMVNSATRRWPVRADDQPRHGGADSGGGLGGPGGRDRGRSRARGPHSRSGRRSRRSSAPSTCSGSRA